MLRAAFGLLVPLLILGCESAGPPMNSEPPVPIAPAISSPTSPADRNASDSVSTEPTEKVFEGITLTIPAGWEEHAPPNDIIQAEYHLTAPAGSIRVTMSSAGGSKEANIQRWRGQFTRGPNDSEPQEETVVIDGEEAILVELVGTFRDGFGGGGEQRGETTAHQIGRGPERSAVRWGWAGLTDAGTATASWTIAGDVIPCDSIELAGSYAIRDER